MGMEDFTTPLTVLLNWMK